jgi:hypothetical protein
MGRGTGVSDRWVEDRTDGCGGGWMCFWAWRGVGRGIGQGWNVRDRDGCDVKEVVGDGCRMELKQGR